MLILAWYILLSVCQTDRQTHEDEICCTSITSHDTEQENKICNIIGFLCTYYLIFLQMS